jgi:hypothetical protein
MVGFVDEDMARFSSWVYRTFPESAAAQCSRFLWDVEWLAIA